MLPHVPDGEGFKVFFKILFILLAEVDNPAILGKLVPHKLGLDLSDLFLWLATDFLYHHTFLEVIQEGMVNFGDTFEILWYLAISKMVSTNLKHDKKSENIEFKIHTLG